MSGYMTPEELVEFVRQALENPETLLTEMGDTLHRLTEPQDPATQKKTLGVVGRGISASGML